MSLNNDPTLNSWIGKGLTFPIELVNGRAVISEGYDMIEHSLDNILGWAVGDRFMLGEFGSLLYRLIEEPNDEVLIGLARVYIVDAISRWEKRIQLVDTIFTVTSPTSLRIELRYRLTNSQLEQTYVYPFYTTITT